MAWPGKPRVDLIGLNRASDKVVLAKFRVVNESPDSLEMPGFSQYIPDTTIDDGLLSNATASIRLIDTVNHNVHYVLLDEGNKCLCTRFESYMANLEAGGTREIVAALPAPPDNVDKVTLLFPETVPFADVEIGANAETSAVLEDGAEPVDLTATPTREPMIEQVVSTVEDPNKAEDDDGKNLKVRLSADVLFALNKATLTSKAESVINEVAGKIDKAPAKTVRIDGYTDSSGNDTINIPLSKRRAAAVEKALKEAVTRSGVGYESAGHGSADPVASNETKEGRKQNRRVAVTFEHARAAETATGQPPGSEETDDLSKQSAVATMTTGGEKPYWVTPFPDEMRIEIHGIRRGGHGYATLVYTLHNESAEDLNTGVAFGDNPGYLRPLGPHLVSLMSGEKRIRAAKTLKTRQCVCTGIELGSKTSFVSSGNEHTLFDVFRLPPGVNEVSVDVPGFNKSEPIQIK